MSWATAGWIALGFCLALWMMMTFSLTHRGGNRERKMFAWHLVLYALDIAMVLTGFILGFGLQVQSWWWVLAPAFFGRFVIHVFNMSGMIGRPVVDSDSAPPGVQGTTMNDAKAFTLVIPPHGIYVASKTRHADVWVNFRASGFPIISTWIDEAGVGETKDLGELWMRIEEEIRTCKAMVFYAQPGDSGTLRGEFIEVGMALGMGKPVHVDVSSVPVVSQTLRPIGSWLHHPLVTQHESLFGALSAARDEGL